MIMVGVKYSWSWSVAVVVEAKHRQLAITGFGSNGNT